MKKLICFMCAILIGLTAVAGIFSVPVLAEAGPNGNLAAAFTGEGKLRLVPGSLFEVPAGVDYTSAEIGPAGFLSLSPDGKSILYGGEQGNELALGILRDGEMHNFTFRTDGSSGDLSGSLATLGRQLLNLPGLEGISWSADGRYAVLSDIYTSLNKMKSLNIPVVDTVSGEAWIADSYPSGKLAEDGNGIVYISKISRSGEYVYYIARVNDGGDMHLRFCRCATDGGNREILYDQNLKDGQSFGPYTWSDLTEEADGSWQLLACSGAGRNRNDTVVLVHLHPGAGDAWDADILYTPMRYMMLTPFRFTHSPVSGYTLFGVATTMVSTQATVQGNPANEALLRMINRVNLIRLAPGSTDPYEAWYMRRSGPEGKDMEMASGQEYLPYLLVMGLGWTPELPKDLLAEPAPDPTILNLSLSPDGRYALLLVNARTEEIPRNYGLYLLDVETMAVRPVEAPEGTVSVNMVPGTALSRTYQPALTWNPDGTIVLLTGNSMLGFYQLTVQE